MSRILVVVTGLKRQGRAGQRCFSLAGILFKNLINLQVADVCPDLGHHVTTTHPLFH